jgi:hypothetical protein
MSNSASAFVGDDDVRDRTVGVNPRGGDVVRGVDLDSFVAQVADEASVGLG